MSSFSFAEAAKAGGAWAGIMGMGVSLIYLPEIPGRDMLLTIIYPILLSLASRVGAYNVSRDVLFVASFLAIGYISIARLVSKRADEALDDPLNNKSVSGPLLGVLAAFYGLGVILGSFILRSPFNNKIARM